MFADLGRMTRRGRGRQRGLRRNIEARIQRRKERAASILNVSAPKTLSGFGDIGSSKSKNKASRRILFGAGVAFASTVGYTLWAEHRRRKNAARRAKDQATIARAQSAAAASEAARQEALGRAIAFESQARRLEAEAADLKARAEAAEASAQVAPPAAAETAAAQAAGTTGFKQMFTNIPTWAWVVGAGAVGLMALRR